jgi:hypothetical protein
LLECSLWSDEYLGAKSRQVLASLGSFGLEVDFELAILLKRSLLAYPEWTWIFFKDVFAVLTFKVFGTVGCVIDLELGSLFVSCLFVSPTPVCFSGDLPTPGGNRCKIPDPFLGTSGTFNFLRAILLSEFFTGDFIGDLDLVLVDIKLKVTLLLLLAAVRFDVEVGVFLGILYEAREA